MRSLFLTVALALTQPAAAVCPDFPDRSAERAGLLADLKSAQGFGEAQAAINGMWMFWRTAPDEVAQELLDTGTSAIRYGDFLRAEDALGRLTDYCPDYPEGWNQIAFAYFLQNRDEQALAALERAIALEPAHFGALAGVALIHIRAGRAALAQIWLRRAVDVNPWLNERGLLDQRPEGGDDL